MSGMGPGSLAAQQASAYEVKLEACSADFG